MAIRDVIPYLYFNGNAEEAIRLYERALGAKVEGIMRYGEAPPDTGTCPPEDKDRVMHASIRLGARAVFISDTPTSQPMPMSQSVQITLELEDADELGRMFDALAAGGKVHMPVADQFWGDRMGMLTDAYGVGWLLTCPSKKG